MKAVSLILEGGRTTVAKVRVPVTSFSKDKGKDGMRAETVHGSVGIACDAGGP